MLHTWKHTSQSWSYETKGTECKYTLCSLYEESTERYTAKKKKLALIQCIQGLTNTNYWGFFLWWRLQYEPWLQTFSQLKLSLTLEKKMIMIMTTHTPPSNPQPPISLRDKNSSGLWELGHCTVESCRAESCKVLPSGCTAGVVSLRKWQILYTRKKRTEHDFLPFCIYTYFHNQEAADRGTAAFLLCFWCNTVCKNPFCATRLQLL